MATEVLWGLVPMVQRGTARVIKRAVACPNADQRDAGSKYLKIKFSWCLSGSGLGSIYFAIHHTVPRIPLRGALQ